MITRLNTKSHYTDYNKWTLQSRNKNYAKRFDLEPYRVHPSRN